MKHITLMAATILMVTSCATVKSSGVQRIGQDRYTVTVSNEGLKLAGTDNSAKTRTKAINDANAFCQSKGESYADIYQQDIVRNETATAILYFRCAH